MPRFAVSDSPGGMVFPRWHWNSPHRGAEQRHRSQRRQPLRRDVISFAVAVLVAGFIAVGLYGVPSLAQLKGAPISGYGAGCLMCLYVLSATVIIPRFGAASFVAFILIAQLVGSTLIDQFGLFGMTRRPVDTMRLVGLTVIAAGIAIMEIGNLRKIDP
jgi:transporter family-2 protein